MLGRSGIEQNARGFVGLRAEDDGASGAFEGLARVAMDVGEGASPMDRPTAAINRA
jgi:hypothetical protein